MMKSLMKAAALAVIAASGIAAAPAAAHGRYDRGGYENDDRSDYRDNSSRWNRDRDDRYENGRSWRRDRDDYGREHRRDRHRHWGWRDR